MRASRWANPWRHTCEMQEGLGGGTDPLEIGDPSIARWEEVRSRNGEACGEGKAMLCSFCVILSAR
jgi:hypothetical protein